jgi:hypothetical protein
MILKKRLTGYAGNLFFIDMMRSRFSDQDLQSVTLS